MSTRDFEILAEALCPTGSRVICNPPVMDTDEDFVLLVDNLDKANHDLTELGFVGTSESYGPGERFVTYRRRQDDVNLIVTSSPSEFWRWSQATYLAKRFNLTKKTDRKALFRVIVDRKEPDDAGLDDLDLPF